MALSLTSTTETIDLKNWNFSRSPMMEEIKNRDLYQPEDLISSKRFHVVLTTGSGFLAVKIEVRTMVAQ